MVENLCLILGLEELDLIECRRRIELSLKDFLRTYEKFLHHLIELFLRNLVDLINEYNNSVVRIELKDQGIKDAEEIISVDEKLREYVSNLVKELKNLSMMLANLSRIETLSIDLRGLNLMGLLDTVFKFFPELIISKFRDVMNALNNELRRKIPITKEYGIIFITHRSMWSLDDLSTLLDKVYEAGRKSTLMRLLNEVGIEDLWRSKDGVLYVTKDGETSLLIY